MNSEERLTELEARFRTQFKSRGKSKPKTIERVAGSKKVNVRAEQLERESQAHHETESQLLRTINQFAAACKRAKVEVKFTPAMRSVLDDHGIRRVIRPEALHEKLARDGKIRSAVAGHNKRMQRLYEAASKIRAKHGFGTQN